ncbi:hypothetical protein PHYBLDRAFT_73429 [Phycomyces blakesleeanus NRRL 1555(-)]|uniref:Uncharacterized protein n=1 Tax=Phycomyces blakesleeanus (strain ATCC 8743b / DSM 1359 / FGSC 10004 / NBRC 33097 / NRRL 1555) TaxID=763407 RepID=A0A162VBS5_PHYB8|nr:hypothetical protein PHYBLDRAFT_73429 [Phycomyces blakesleeanus NRRL 1555(-)]OAD81543.1 hypothetical protein PHYBLDRAFT_73429 [Phycomyces blakesleeanus NRRL 1555(-)]|eukprot:XP_018299583.1 hypothetical protein PHYBLDRAFT_73429 [Phycomyces blakesleeanus NRRL 1555(-)]
MVIIHSTHLGHRRDSGICTVDYTTCGSFGFSSQNGLPLGFLLQDFIAIIIDELFAIYCIQLFGTALVNSKGVFQYPNKLHDCSLYHIPARIDLGWAANNWRINAAFLKYQEILTQDVAEKVASDYILQSSNEYRA